MKSSWLVILQFVLWWHHCDDVTVMSSGRLKDLKHQVWVTNWMWWADREALLKAFSRCIMGNVGSSVRPVSPAFNSAAQIFTSSPKCPVRVLSNDPSCVSQTLVTKISVLKQWSSPRAEQLKITPTIRIIKFYDAGRHIERDWDLWSATVMQSEDVWRCENWMSGSSAVIHSIVKSILSSSAQIQDE